MVYHQAYKHSRTTTAMSSTTFPSEECSYVFGFFLSRLFSAFVFEWVYVCVYILMLWLQVFTFIYYVPTSVNSRSTNSEWLSNKRTHTFTHTSKHTRNRCARPTSCRFVVDVCSMINSNLRHSHDVICSRNENNSALL